MSNSNNNNNEFNPFQFPEEIMVQYDQQAYQNLVFINNGPIPSILPNFSDTQAGSSTPVIIRTTIKVELVEVKLEPLPVYMESAQIKREVAEPDHLDNLIQNL